MPLDLDEEYLGQRLPGSPKQRLELLEYLKDILEEHWEQYFRQNGEQHLADPNIALDSGMI